MVISACNTSAKQLFFMIITLIGTIVGIEADQRRLTEHFDAFGTYHDIAEGDRSFGEALGTYFEPSKRGTTRVLAIGCGVSKFYEEMALDGYGSIDCIDRQHEAKRFLEDQWRSLGLSESSYTYAVGDLFEFVTNAASEGKQWDVVLDKGVLELMPSSKNDKMLRMFDEFHHILSGNGMYVQIGPFPPHGQPDLGWRLDGRWAPSTWPEAEWEEHYIGELPWKMVSVEPVKSSRKHDDPPIYYVYLTTPARGDENGKAEVQVEL